MKGVYDLIQALTDLDVQCVVVGGGPDENYLRRIVLAAGLADRIHFTGPLPHQAVGRLYRHAYALIHPSYAEGFPLVVIEAMTNGLPVIVARTPGIDEIIEDGLNGLLFEPGDVSKLRSLVRRVFDDKPLRDTLSLKAAEAMKRMSPYRTGEALVNLYKTQCLT
jgi:glycosyltransferase involved in cell wall biosynthesis